MLKKILVLTVCTLLLFTSAAYGNELPPELDAPTGLVIVQRGQHEDGSNYYILECNVSESVAALSSKGSHLLVFQVDYKARNGQWKSESSDAELPTGVLLLSGRSAKMDFDPATSYLIRGIDTTDLFFRVRIGSSSWTLDESEERLSGFSNTVSVGTDAADTLSPSQEGFYLNASSWAAAELDKAVRYGFITDKIKDNMKAPITREEFCEVVVRLYEKLTGNTASYGSNPFSDTFNAEILKAYELGVVKGGGEGKFAPNSLVTRQEISVMLNRAVKVCKPNADFSTNGVSRFKDEAQIASWAIDAVRFMSKNGIIKGAGDGSIDPEGNTTREQAVLLVVRTYEKYLN